MIRLTTCLAILFSLPLVVTRSFSRGEEAMAAVADFPPNPEDGELWLPSDIYMEIASIDAIKPPRKAHFPPFLHHDVVVHPYPLSPAQIKVHETFLVSQPKLKRTAGTAGNEQPTHVSAGGILHPSWNGRFPINTKKAIGPPPTDESQARGSSSSGTTGKTALFLRGKREGTGVFLPRPRSFAAAAADMSGQLRGTGVFLNHNQTMARIKKGAKKSEVCEEKSFAKKAEVWEKKYIAREKKGEQKEEYELPSEWTY